MAWYLPPPHQVCGGSFRQVREFPDVPGFAVINFINSILVTDALQNWKLVLFRVRRFRDVLVHELRVLPQIRRESSPCDGDVSAEVGEPFEVAQVFRKER